MFTKCCGRFVFICVRCFFVVVVLLLLFQCVFNCYLQIAKAIASLRFLIFFCFVIVIVCLFLFLSKSCKNVSVFFIVNYNILFIPCKHTLVDTWLYICIYPLDQNLRQRYWFQLFLEHIPYRLQRFAEGFKTYLMYQACTQLAKSWAGSCVLTFIFVVRMKTIKVVQKNWINLNQVLETSAKQRNDL